LNSVLEVSGALGGGSISNLGDESPTFGEERAQLSLGGREDVYEDG